MSGNDINELHLPNIQLISLTLDIFHFDISSKVINEYHPSNIFFISVSSLNDNCLKCNHEKKFVLL